MKKILMAALPIAALTIGGYFYMNQKTVDAGHAEQTETLAPHLADRVLGDANAPLTILEYANFTCTHCGDLHRTVMPKLKAEYVDTGKVKIVYREIITDGPGVLATSLARCVPENQYFGMAATLYDGQKTWAYDQTSIDGVKAALKKYASLAGLAETDFDKCLNDTKMQEEMVAHAQANADKDKVQGTPTLILNGKAIESWQWEKLKVTLDEALK